MTTTVPTELEKLLAASGAEPGADPAGGTGPTPLSVYQDRIWRAHLVAGSAAYAVPCVFDLVGDVDTARVVTAACAVIATEPQLTGSVAADGDGFRLMPGTGELAVEHLDVADPDAAATEFLARPFATGVPLTRLAVIRAAGHPDRVAIAFHHVVMDGAAMAVFVNDLRGEVQTPGSAALVPRSRYHDVARVRPDADAWWDRRLRARLDGEPWAPDPDAGHALVTSGSAGDPQDGAAGTVRSTAMWLTAIALTLARVTGHSAQCFAVPLANRCELEDFDALGPLVNTVPLFVDVDDAQPVGELLEDVERELSAAIAHSATDLGAVSEAIRAEHPTFHVPMNVLVNLQSVAHGDVPLGGGVARPVSVHSGAVKGALTVSVNTTGGDVLIESALAGWTADTHVGLRAAFSAVLRALAADPQRPAGAVDIGVVGAPARRAPTSGSIIAEILERAGHDPGRTAVTTPDGDLTWGELAAGTAAAARVLRDHGVRPGDAVLVATARGRDFVVWAGAVMVLGAAYVPVDPERGAARVASVAEQSGAQLGICAVPLPGVRTIDPVLPAADAVPAPEPVTDAQLPAYVIFTSGTTGRPKGVPVTHANLLALQRATADLIGADDVVSAVHAFTFDFSVWEVWIALAQGARVVLYGDDVVRDPYELGDRLTADGVSVLSLTNTALGSLLTAIGRDGGAVPTAVRRLILGGEAVAPRYVRAWWDLLGPRAQVVNMLGATETTVHTTRRDVAPEDLDSPSVQVGGALDHLDVVVLDPAGRALPPGVTGEIAVRGAGVALGYLGRGALTAARFVPDPFPGVAPGARMYLTGDAGRWLGAGRLLCQGRLDGQVKVRGHRIETAGVEAVLTRHPRVLRACVVAHDDLLHAFVEFAPGTDPAELRAHAAATLAEYEVPDRVHGVHSFPMTVNGKVDRDPEKLLAAVHAPARDAHGGGLVTAISEVLGGEPVDPALSFLANGGDSITAVRLVGELRDRGVRISVGEVLSAPSVQALCTADRAAVETEGDDAAVGRFAMIPDDVRDGLPFDVSDAYPLSAAQEGMLFHIRADPELGVYHNTVSVRIRGGLDPAAFRVALADTMRRHDVLRTAVDELRHDEPLQLVHRDVPAPLTVVAAPPGDAERVIAEIVAGERVTPFDLDRAPLFRITLVRVAPGEDQLIISDCHVILDGWSWTSTLAEVVTRHNALVRRDGDYDRTLAPDVRVRFADFVALERRTRADGTAAQAWGEHLRGARPWSVADVRADTGAAGRRVGRAHVPITAETAERLAVRARDEGVSLRHLAMAVSVRAIGAVLGNTAGAPTDEVLTGITANGRLERAGGTDVRGMFLNMVPLRFPTADDAGDQARACARVEAAMAAHRRLPNIDIAQLVGRGPLFDFGFNFVQFQRLKEIEESHRFGTTEADSHFSQEDTDLALMATFSVHPPEHRLALMLIADESRVSASRRSRLAASYAAALDWAAGGPGGRR